MDVNFNEIFFKDKNNFKVNHQKIRKNETSTTGLLELLEGSFFSSKWLVGVLLETSVGGGHQVEATDVPDMNNLQNTSRKVQLSMLLLNFMDQLSLSGCAAQNPVLCTRVLKEYCHYIQYVFHIYQCQILLSSHACILRCCLSSLWVTKSLPNWSWLSPAVSDVLGRSASTVRLKWSELLLFPPHSEALLHLFVHS